MTDFNLRLWLSSLDPALLHFATFALMFLEGAGIPGIPGVLPMLAQVAEIDAGHTTLAAAIFWGTLGNWLGSVAGYAAGRWGRRWLPEHWLSKLESERVLGLMRRWGPLLIVASRTIGSLRTPVTILSGTTHYPLVPYTVYSLIGALIHVGVWQVLLWKFGPAILPQLERYGREIVLILIPIVALSLTARWFWKRQQTRKAALSEVKAEAEEIK